MQIYIKSINQDYPKLLQELEQYTYYILRCLHRVGIHPRPVDFALLTIERTNGNIAEILVYPTTSIKENKIETPMFLYGFKADYDFTNLETPIQITFSENYEELKQ